MKNQRRQGKGGLYLYNKDASSLSQKIGGEIGKLFGFEPRVLLLEGEALARAMAENPFPEAESDPKALHLGFLLSVPQKPRLEALEGLKRESERYRLIEKVFYLHAPEGGGPIQARRRCREIARRPDDRSKLANGAKYNSNDR